MGAPVVLLVDDDPDVLQSLEALVHLLAKGAAIHALADGARALAAIPRIRPDVIITDLQMPNLGGRDLASMLNQLGNGARIIVLSGARSDELAQARGLPNVVAVLSKPVDVGALKSALALAFDKPSAGQ